MTTSIDPQDLKLQLEEAFGLRFVPGRNGVIGTVSPASEAELRTLILCTSESGVPLVPRGAGSSPFNGRRTAHEVILSTELLNNILAVDEHAQLARVQPGVVWADLIEQLRMYSLMPRVFPSSAAFSTVGGFVAQGGVGVGSFEYGPIVDSVASVRVMGSDGEVEHLADGLQALAVGAEGRTGILLEVVLRLQPAAAMEPVVAVFNRAAEMEECLADVSRRGLPLWSVGLMDRTAVDLQIKLERDTFELPPGRYAALFSFRGVDRLQLLPRLRGIVLAAGGKLIATTGGHDLWVQRFMNLQALGTTCVPMQFRFRLGELAPFLESIPGDVRRELAFEGVVADLAHCITLRFFLTHRPAVADMTTPRQLLQLAKAHGGQVYATGAFFLEEAAAVFGQERLNRMAAFHSAVDPEDRLNPGVGFETGTAADNLS